MVTSDISLGHHHLQQQQQQEAARQQQEMTLRQQFGQGTSTTETALDFYYKTAMSHATLPDLMPQMQLGMLVGHGYHHHHHQGVPHFGGAPPPAAGGQGGAPPLNLSAVLQDVLDLMDDEDLFSDHEDDQEDLVRF